MRCAPHHLSSVSQRDLLWNTKSCSSCTISSATSTGVTTKTCSKRQTLQGIDTTVCAPTAADYIHAKGHKPLLIEKAQRDSAPQFLSVESLVSLFVLLLLLLLLFLPGANAAPAATATATAAAATAAVSRCCFFFFVFPSILPLSPR